MDKAAFLGSFVDARFMPGIKSMRVMVDIPIEHANAFLAAFGAPDRANPVPVAIARLATSHAGRSGTQNGPDSREPEPLAASTTAPDRAGAPKADKGECQDKPRTPFRELPRSQQAAIKLQDKEFAAWLVDTRWNGKEEVGDYDGLLKRVLSITSKRELDADEDAGKCWDQLLTDYDTRSYAR